MSTSIPKTSGIYIIVCGLTGKCYLGSALNLQKRKREHFLALKAQKHYNKHLQRAVNKYGLDSFTFRVVELCDREILLEREQYYLDWLQPFGERGFNIAIDATKGMNGRQHTAKTKLRQSRTAKLRSTPEYRENISAKLKGHPGHMKGRKLTPEQIDKVKRRHNKKWIVVMPDGTELRIIGLSEFCRKNNLIQGHMVSVAQGKRKHHKGWKCRRDKGE